MTLKTLRIGIWAAVGALAVVAGGVYLYQSFYPDAQRAGIASAKLGAPFNLIDHNGNPIDQTAFEAMPTAIFFGFTHCPEVCPTTLNELALWLEELGPDGQAIKPFFITVDPKRDTPEVMKSYVSAFSDRITGITGDPDAVAALLKAWRVYAAEVPLKDGDYTMDHTASIYLVRPDGSFQGTIAFRENPANALQKLRRLAESAES